VIIWRLGWQQTWLLLQMPTEAAAQLPAGHTLFRGGPASCDLWLLFKDDVLLVVAKGVLL
jgi:hypothetical protein